jgi:predicted DNA-binding protein (UPF0251 family)
MNEQQTERLRDAEPELLEALRVVASLTVPQSTALKSVWISHGRKWSDALIQARAAIAKATGGDK